jgi:hypothetical protein
MTLMARTLMLSMLIALAFAVPAGAAAPTLVGVGHDGLHPTARLAAAAADDGTVYLSPSPERATDGSFLTLEVLADREIGDSLMNALMRR